MRMLSTSRGIAAAVFLTLLLAAHAFPSQGKRARARIRPQAVAADCSSVGDEALAARVRDKLSKVRSLRGRSVAVRAEGGAVTLAGDLGTRRRRLDALRVTKSVPCVKSADALPCGPGEHLCVAGPKEGECLPNSTPCPTDQRRRK